MGFRWDSIRKLYIILINLGLFIAIYSNASELYRSSSVHDFFHCFLKNRLWKMFGHALIQNSGSWDHIFFCSLTLPWPPLPLLAAWRLKFEKNFKGLLPPKTTASALRQNVEFWNGNLKIWVLFLYQCL